jgi:hypothetical protein
MEAILKKIAAAVGMNTRRKRVYLSRIVVIMSQ